MGGRALVYPLSTLVVPVAWFIWFRRSPYPIAIDITLGLPFLIDTAGNALNLYDTITWWDDLTTSSTGPYSPPASFSLACSTASLPGCHGSGFTVGFGAVTAILWEMADTSPSFATPRNWKRPTPIPSAISCLAPWEPSSVPASSPSCYRHATCIRGR